MQPQPETGIAALAFQEDTAEISGIPPEVAAVILVIGLTLYALVNAVEIAIAGVNRLRIRALAEEGSVAARSVQRLLDRQEHFFAFIVLLQNVGVVLASTMGGFLAAEAIGGVTGVVIGTVVITLGLALFGEITPKVLAAHSGERFPLIVAPVVSLLMVGARPIVIALAAAPGLLSRVIFGSREGITQTVTEAELRVLIDIGVEEGVVEHAQAELLGGVFSFTDLRLNAVMIPRNETVWVAATATVGDFLATYREHPHSRFPVFGSSHDDVVGVVNIKDVLLAISRDEVDESAPARELVRTPLFLPETKPVSEAFAEMRQVGHQLAVVVDEYGGTAGIVTLEILLEELVGYLGDELGRHETEWERLDEHTFRVRGSLSVREANDDLGLDLPEDDAYETVAGLILERLGGLPEEGEAIHVDALTLVVSRTSGSRIEQVVISRH